MVLNMASMAAGALGFLVILLATYAVYEYGERRALGRNNVVNMEHVEEFDKGVAADRALRQDINTAQQAQKQGVQNGKQGNN